MGSRDSTAVTGRSSQRRRQLSTALTGWLAGMNRTPLAPSQALLLTIAGPRTTPPRTSSRNTTAGPAQERPHFTSLSAYTLPTDRSLNSLNTTMKKRDSQSPSASGPTRPTRRQGSHSWRMTRRACIHLAPTKRTSPISRGQTMRTQTQLLTQPSPRRPSSTKCPLRAQPPQISMASKTKTLNLPGSSTICLRRASHCRRPLSSSNSSSCHRSQACPR